MRRSRPPRKTVGNIGSASCTVGLMSVPRPTPTPLTSTSTDMRRTRTPPRAEAEGVCKEGGRGPLALLAGSLDGAARPTPPSLPAHLMGCAAHTSLLAGSLDGLRGNTPSLLPADLPSARQLLNNWASRAARPGCSPRSSMTFVREVNPLTRPTSARRRSKALATANRAASVAAPSTARGATLTMSTGAWPSDPSPYCPPTLGLEAPGLTRTLTLTQPLCRPVVVSCRRRQSRLLRPSPWEAGCCADDDRRRVRRRRGGRPRRSPRRAARHHGQRGVPGGGRTALR